MEHITTKEVAIIGAGLTGLTLAYYLKKAGIGFVLIEKQNCMGGVMQTQERDGFVYEAGPNTGIISRPEVAELFDELNPACKIELANPKSKNRWILKHGKWEPVPGGFIAAIRTPLFTFKDKFGILAEPFRAKGKDPMETVATMVKRRLGQSYLDYAVDPFISGIYAGDPNQLITKYALPKLYALEQNYGSFIGGAIRKSREPKTKRDLRVSKEVFSAKGGFHNLIRAIEESLSAECSYMGISNPIVRKIEHGFTTSFTTADGKPCTLNSKWLVTTTNAQAIKELFDFIPKDELAPITSLRYAKVVQVVMAYSKWNGPELNAFGGLIPSKENRNVLGVLFPSSIFQDRAPAGGALLSVFLGGINKPQIIEMTDDALIRMVRDELNALLQVEQSKEAFAKIFRYQYAIPQYDESSPERLAGINKLEKKFPGLLLAGNIRDGIGIADRIGQAADLANLIANPRHE
jgi:protoporphyrinogen/coproporphyrinogen III oxidase